jgi:hypothetical protein
MLAGSQPEDGTGCDSDEDSGSGGGGSDNRLAINDIHELYELFFKHKVTIIDST